MIPLLVPQSDVRQVMGPGITHHLPRPAARHRSKSKARWETPPIRPPCGYLH